MKRFLGVLLLIFTLNACDDGDFEIESFDFSNVSSNRCNSGETGFFIYKINSLEVLLMQIPENSFENQITEPGIPRTLAINATNKVVYRIYDGAVTTGTICASIPPGSPTVVDEWTALAGTIEIVTTVNKTVNAANNSTTVTGYTHNIVLKNVNFQKGNGSQQLYTSLTYGNYVTSAVQPADFQGFTIKNCGGSFDFIYKISGSQSISLAIADAIFQNVVTTDDNPRTTLMNDTNQLVISIYDNTVNDAFVCSSEPLAFPILQQKWVSVNGEENVSGIIEVRTAEQYQIPTDNQSPLVGYRHKVTLKNVTMTRNNVDFKLGDVYEYGEFVIPL